MTNFLKMLRDESGASAAEYALILAIIGVVIAGAALTLGGAIGGRMESAATCITGGTLEDCGGSGDGGGDDTGGNDTNTL
jgi:pilus assembly protein Flp/PilA